MFAHYINASVPVIKITNNGNTFCIWCPYRKTYTFDSIHLGNMRSELFIHFKVITFGQKININISQYGRKTIYYIGFAEIINRKEALQ